MTDLKKAIEKLSGYKGPTLKTLIPKTRSINQILGIKKRKTEFHRIIIASQKILFKPHLKRKKRLHVRRFKVFKRKRQKIGDANTPIPPTTNLPSTPTVLSQPSHMLTSVEQVIHIKLSPNGKKELESAKDFDMRFYRSRMKDIADGMNVLYLALRATAAQLISRHVPKDTGDLRRSLLSSMSSKSTKFPPNKPRRENQLELHVGFYSDIPYLTYVNRPRVVINVRHHRNQGIISYRGGRHYLHDPTAKTKFMFTTKAAIRQAAKNLTKEFIRRLYIKWGYTRPYVKSLFRYPGMGRGI
ncbi:hypothetical protein LCGC14_1343550 [marine sediment metagenome]|uniref:Uncharacterized protein n=1 Tax=marine sediment metagenome TaxID=412755 RepID=A0A0F9MTU3_9ZZZZ